MCGFAKKLRELFVKWNEKPTLQAIIDTLDTSSNVIKRGDILFKASDETLVTTMINIEKFRLDLDGQNTVLKWTGNQTDSMVRVYDSSFTKVKNFSLIGEYVAYAASEAK